MYLLEPSRARSLQVLESPSWTIESSFSNGKSGGKSSHRNTAKNPLVDVDSQSPRPYLWLRTAKTRITMNHFCSFGYQTGMITGFSPSDHVDEGLLLICGWLPQGWISQKNPAAPRFFSRPWTAREMSYRKLRYGGRCRRPDISPQVHRVQRSRASPFKFLHIEKS